MSRVSVNDDYLKGVGRGIRYVNGTENTYTPAEFENAIKATKKTLTSKSVTTNGTYNPADDSADGYSGVTVNVPNSYAAVDEGKVVSGGALVAQTARPSSITQNGTYDTTNNNSVTVNVSGASATLVPKNITANGSYNPASDSADGYSGVTVNVANSYGAGDEGKVVSGGALVAQTSKSVTANGTVDTTTNNSVTVNVQPVTETLSATQNGTYTPSAGKDGFSSVAVNVQPVTETLSVTQNGTYTPSSGKDGFSSVAVNVPSATVKRVKLGSTSTILDTSRVVSSGANRLDYLIPVDANGQEIEIDITKDIEVFIKFKLTQAIASQATLYVFGEKTPSNAILPTLDFRYESNEYYTCYKGYVLQKISSNQIKSIETLLRSYTQLPVNTWITAYIHKRVDLEYDLTITVGGAAYNDTDAGAAAIQYTGSYVPVIGSTDSDGYGATLASTPGTIIEIGECYIKQEGVTIW